MTRHLSQACDVRFGELEGCGQPWTGRGRRTLPWTSCCGTGVCLEPRRLRSSGCLPAEDIQTTSTVDRPRKMVRLLWETQLALATGIEVYYTEGEKETYSKVAIVCEHIYTARILQDPNPN